MKLFDIKKAQEFKTKDRHAVGARVYSIIIENYISIAAIAKIMDVSTAILTSWMYGTFKPSQQKADKVAKIVTALEICVEEGLIRPPEPVPGYNSLVGWWKGKKALRMIYGAFEKLQDDING